MPILDLSIHILLVEDDEVDIQDIKRAFIKNNIASPLHVAKNGVEALNMLRGENGEKKLVPTPRIVLLDINMPKMNGIEFLKILRSDPNLKHLFVFILTSSNEQKDKIAAFNLNVAGYVVKPIKLENFTQAISTLNLYWDLMEFPI